MKIRDKSNGKYACLEITDGGIIIYPRQGYDAVRIGFNEIESIKTTLHVIEQTYKGNKYSKLSEMRVEIQSGGLRYFFISNCSWGIVYNLLTFKNRFEDFVLNVIGASDGIDIPIKIYSKFGIKFFIKDADSVFYMETMAAIFTGIPIYEYIEAQASNSFDLEVQLPIILIFLTISLIIASPIVYQEFLKWKIRRMIGV